MKKRLISAAVLTALSSTQLNADGQSFSKDKLLVPCIKVPVAGANKFYNVRLKLEKDLENFKIQSLSEEKDVTACMDSAKRLKGIGFDDKSSDDDSMDDDSSDDDSMDDDSSDDDSMDDDSSDDDSMDDDSSDDDSMDGDNK